MKTFLRLMRFQERTTGLLASLKFMAKHDKKEFNKNLTVLIILGVALLPIYGFYLVTAGSLTAAFIQMQMQRALFTLAFTAFCIVGLVFGLLSMMGRLFLSKDNEFFAMLPVKPSTVFAAKFARIYITQLIFSLLFLLPISISYGIMGGGAASIIISVIIILIIPAIPLLIAALLAVLLMPLTRHTKNRERAAMIISMVFMLVIVVGQLLLTSNMPENIDQAYILAMLQNNGEFINTLSGFFPPAAWMACAVTGTDRILNLALSLLIALGGGALTCYIAGKLYYRGMQAQFEGHKGKKKNVKLAARSSAVMSIFKKEWKVITKTPVYAMNALCGAVIMPVMCIVMGFSIGGDAGELKQIAADNIWLTALIAGAFLGFMGSLNTGGATMITREGKSYFVLKMIPVSMQDIIKGKLLCSVSISLISILPSAIIMGILFIGPASAAAAFLISMLIGFVDCCICMLFDCYRPKLDWSSQQVAIKQTLNSGMCMIVSFALIILLAIIAAFAVIFAGDAIAVIIVMLLLAAASLLLYRMTIVRGAVFLNRLNG